MDSDAIVNVAPMTVLYVRGQPDAPISVQAPAAFRELEEKLGSLRGRRFYGAIHDGEYRACVAVRPGDDTGALALAQGWIEGGKYVRRRFRGWDGNVAIIEPSFTELCARADYDPSRPTLEYYRSQRELHLMAPVR
jgi:hypothetical protein